MGGEVEAVVAEPAAEARNLIPVTLSHPRCGDVKALVVDPTWSLAELRAQIDRKLGLQKLHASRKKYRVQVAGKMYDVDNPACLQEDDTIVVTSILALSPNTKYRRSNNLCRGEPSCRVVLWSLLVAVPFLLLFYAPLVYIVKKDRVVHYRLYRGNTVGILCGVLLLVPSHPPR